MRTFISAPLFVLVALLALPGGALAAQPIQERAAVSGDVIVTDCGFPMAVHFDARSVNTIQFGTALDAFGLPVISRASFQFHNVITWSANGKSLLLNVDWIITQPHILYLGPTTVTLDDGSAAPASLYQFQDSVNGLVGHVRLPGGGTVSIDAGRVTFLHTIAVFADGSGVDVAAEDFQVDGPHPTFADMAASCAIATEYLS